MATTDDVTRIDALRQQADQEHPPVKIALKDGSEVTLSPLLRLSQNTRDTVITKLRDFDRQNPSVIEQANRRAHIGASVLQLVASDDRLIDELDGDAVLIDKVLSWWRSATEDHTDHVHVNVSDLGTSSK